MPSSSTTPKNPILTLVSTNKDPQTYSTPLFSCNRVGGGHERIWGEPTWWMPGISDNGVRRQKRQVSRSSAYTTTRASATTP
eukprot:746547-Hanusia_phi.AAC.2